jgi:hypothetical protein
VPTQGHPNDVDNDVKDVTVPVTASSASKNSDTADIICMKHTKYKNESKLSTKEQGKL